MRVSELVKALFTVMSKHGDLDVVGEFEVKDKELLLKGVGFTEEDTAVLPLLAEDKDKTAYL